MLSVHSNDNRIYSDRDAVLPADRHRCAVGSDPASRPRPRSCTQRSLRDPLTGLANRTEAYERIEQALARAEARRSLVAVLLLDIDDFKIINDSLGHEAGDRALVRVASRLAAAARPGDTVARIGGDEFLIVCEDVNGIEHAQHIAQRR